MSADGGTRRPIKARDSKWAASVASALARQRIMPNTISIFSAIFAGLAGVCLGLTPRVSAPVAAALFVGGALGIQMRLLCNLFDGMVAVEGGFRTKSGEVFNELPDRFADAFVLIGLGYAARLVPYGVELGWAAAVLAVITAYVRTLGAAAGAGQNFMGPMAKQHRMALVTGACVASAVLVFLRYEQWLLLATLIVLVVGMVVTIARRTGWVIRTLESK